jgi:type III restriction enzyme
MKIHIENLQYQTDAINQTINSIKKQEQSHFAIEMETGTGKTFTFISTIFAICQQFNYKKFIIVAPRIAIKEGIYKTFQVFAEVFKDKYSNIAYNVSNYDRGKLNVIENFINGHDLQILILTKQSFDKKETNKLRQNNRDELYGLESYIAKIHKTQPVVIIDEPQLNAKFNSQELVELLNPQFVLSYSATHSAENNQNIIYTYSPEQAYNDRQVKRLEYLSIELNINGSLQLQNTDSHKKIAKIKHNNKIYSLKPDDNLGKKTADASLNDYQVKYITSDDIIFANGKRFSEIAGQSASEELILREQIKQTILQHKQKEPRLKNEKIKQISLFFVPAVADFINEKDDGIVKKIFLEEYQAIYQQNADGKYAYYFASGKGKDHQEKEMTKLILQQKEELLSLNNKVEFIFAHTSLGVGWDNPNVFNICFLRHIASENNKKQFVGRGLRLCINSEGKRVFEGSEIKDLDRINNLTIIGSMQYESFCNQYQTEAGWSSKDQPKIGNAAKKQATQIKIKQHKQSLATQLWQRLKPKTKWYINFKDLDKFYQRIINELKAEIIQQKQISIIKGDIKGNIDYTSHQTKPIIENLNINQVIVKIKEKTWLSVAELNKILNALNFNEIKKDQAQFIDKAIAIIENCKKNHIMSIAEVSYQKTGEEFDDQHFFEQEKQSFHANLIESEKSLFNFVDCDSDQEKKFVEFAQNTASVELLVKLPKGSEDKFHINTPLGKYTPDFALLVNGNNKLYMIFEVKSKKRINLDAEEQFKIKCAIKHFTELGFEVATTEIEHPKEANSLLIANLIGKMQDKNASYSVYIPNETA